jgi:hypothetical protein
MYGSHEKERPLDGRLRDPREWGKSVSGRAVPWRLRPHEALLAGN